MDGNNKPWQAPEIKGSDASAEPAELSELATLGNIFIEPGRTFEDLRRKPRFIIATIIMIIIGTSFAFSLTSKIGENAIRQSAMEQMDRNPRADSMTPEQKEGAVKVTVMIQKAIGYAVPVIILISVFVGGLLYWGGAKAFGGSGGYLHGVSVFVYSQFPVAVVSGIANFLILALKTADDIDFATAQRGLAHANLGILVDGKAMPVLATLLSVIDVFAIWGWVLAAIGLRVTNKISAGSAWAITLILASIGVLLRIVGAISNGVAN